MNITALLALIDPISSALLDQAKALLTCLSGNAGVQYMGIVSWTPPSLLPRGPASAALQLDTTRDLGYY